jgi:hypothetical protein
MSAHKFDPNISRLFHQCYDFFKRNPRGDFVATKQYTLVKDALVRTLRALADTYAVYYGGWASDEQNPGYLVSAIGGISCTVPVHLVPLFPSVLHLQKLIELSQILRVSERSILCLSGSNAIVTALEHVDDVDFCEYIPIKDNDFAHCDFFRYQKSHNILAVGLRVGTQKWNSFANAVAQESICNSVRIESETDSVGKMDFVLIDELDGATEVSNILLFCNSSFQGPATRQSFAAQEAPIDTFEPPPNELSSPYQIGRYIDFLDRQIGHLLQGKNTLKALKRSMSLSRIIFAAETTDRISGLLKRSDLATTSEIDKQKRLSRKVESLRGKLGDHIATRIVGKLERKTRLLQAKLDIYGDDEDIIKEPALWSEAQRIYHGLQMKLGISGERNG